MKIYALQNNSGAKYYRIIPQLKWMQSKGHEVYLEQGEIKFETCKQKIDWADIVIFQMVFAEDLQRYARKKGKIIVFEMDDLLHAVPKTHYSYDLTRGVRNRINWWFLLIKTFRKADAFISTNKRLDRVYGRWFKHKLIFPNYISLEHWLKEHKPNTTSRIRLLWAGSTSHTGDLLEMKPILKEVLDRHPEVQFIYIGMGGTRTKDVQAKFIYGDDFFEGLPENREALLPVPGNMWPYILATVNADLAIAPLEKNYFNKFKSQCKFLEYSIARIPAIYSKWFYTDVKNGETGFVAETKEDWIKYLELLINDATLRKNIGENAFNYVLENKNINNYLENWENFLLKLYEQKSTNKTSPVQVQDFRHDNVANSRCANPN
jgi:O-antigen biosynthesis protein